MAIQSQVFTNKYFSTNTEQKKSVILWLGAWKSGQP